MNREFLFVGGCADGTRRPVEVNVIGQPPAVWHMIRPRGQCAVACYGSSAPSVDDIEIETEQYVLVKMCQGPGRPVHSVYVLKGTEGSLFEMLIANYHPVPQGVLGCNDSVRLRRPGRVQWESEYQQQLPTKEGKLAERTLCRIRAVLHNSSQRPSSLVVSPEEFDALVWAYVHCATSDMGLSGVFGHTDGKARMYYKAIEILKSGDIPGVNEESRVKGIAHFMTPAPGLPKATPEDDCDRPTVVNG